MMTTTDSELTTEQAVNLAIAIASWHAEWMRLRHEAMCLPDHAVKDFLVDKFPTIQGTANIIAFEKLAALPVRLNDVLPAIRAILADDPGDSNSC